MTTKIRVVHYLNQFFAQVGSEDKGDLGPTVKAGLIGAGRALQQALGDAGEVVATIFAAIIISPSSKSKPSPNSFATSPNTKPTC